MKRFHAAVGRVFRTRVSKRLERFFNIGQRHAQYLMAGREEPADGMAQALEDQIARLEGVNLEAKLRELITDARKANIHDEVIAAVLADSHEEMFARAID